MSQVVEVKSGLRQTDISGWPSTNDVGLEQRKRCSLDCKLYSITVGQEEQGQTSAVFLEIFKSNVILETGFKAVGLEQRKRCTLDNNSVDQEDQGQTSERILEFSKET